MSSGDGTPIFAGVESQLPDAEGGLRLTKVSLDDRLTSPLPRATAWGDGDRLLTVEPDRVTVWEVATGRAISSGRLPARINEIVAVTATPDLSLAAAVVRQAGDDGVNVTRIVGIHVASGEAVAFDMPGAAVGPFLLSTDGTTGGTTDGAWLIAGGDVRDTETWAHRTTVFVDSEPLGRTMPHPRREAANDAWVSSATALLPARGVRIHERLLAFGPRRLRFTEPYWDVHESGRAAKLSPVPGSVSIASLDEGAPAVQFPVPDPRTIVVLSSEGRFVGTLAGEFKVRSTTSAEPVFLLEKTGWANRALLSDDGRVVVLGYEAPTLVVEERSATLIGDDAPRRHASEPRLEAWDLATRKKRTRRARAGAPRTVLRGVRRWDAFRNPGPPREPSARVARAVRRARSPVDVGLAKLPAG
jgi:hypothetical protein